MEIREVKEHKKQYLSILLLADEQEDMVDRYLDAGTMYVLDDRGVKCECIVTDEGSGILEIKNLATEPGFTRSHSVKNFFTDHYDHPIYECGVQQWYPRTPDTLCGWWQVLHCQRHSRWGAVRAIKKSWNWMSRDMHASNSGLCFK